MQKEQKPYGPTTTSRTKACKGPAGSRLFHVPPPLAAPVILSEADCKATFFHLDSVIMKSAAKTQAAEHSKYETCIIPRLFPRPIEFPCPVPCAPCPVRACPMPRARLRPYVIRASMSPCIRQCICPSVRPSARPPARLFFSAFLSADASFGRPVGPSVRPSVRPSTRASVVSSISFVHTLFSSSMRLFVHPPVHPPVRPSIHPRVGRSIF